MIYYTGDIHGDPYEVIQFCDSKKLTEQDTLVLLGDVGANYYRNRRDTEMKRVLAAVKPTMLGQHPFLSHEAVERRDSLGRGSLSPPAVCYGW